MYMPLSAASAHLFLRSAIFAACAAAFFFFLASSSRKVEREWCGACGGPFPFGCFGCFGASPPFPVHPGARLDASSALSPPREEKEEEEDEGVGEAPPLFLAVEACADGFGLSLAPVVEAGDVAPPEADADNGLPVFGRRGENTRTRRTPDLAMLLKFLFQHRLG